MFFSITSSTIGKISIETPQNCFGSYLNFSKKVPNDSRFGCFKVSWSEHVETNYPEVLDSSRYVAQPVDELNFPCEFV